MPAKDYSQHKVIKLTQQLIRFKTSKDNYQELVRIIDFCQRFFEGSGLVVKRFESHKKPSLVITTTKTKKPDMFMVGHLDVIEAEDKDFKPVVRGRRLYARGASDMKGVTAAMMVVMKELAKHDDKKVGLMLTCDEEVGGENGVHYLLKQGYRCKCAFVPDDGDNWRLVTEEKGALHIKLTAAGKMAHGSRPWEGENAIDKLLRVYSKLRVEFPDAQKPKWGETMNLGRIVGGDATNQVAGWAQMYLDFRFTSKYSDTNLYQKIQRIVGKGVKMEKIISGNVNVHGLESKPVKDFYLFANKFFGKRIKLAKVNGGSDARFFGELGIPSIIIKPKCGNQHAPGEWVDMPSLVAFYDLLKRYLIEG